MAGLCLTAACLWSGLVVSQAQEARLDPKSACEIVTTSESVHIKASGFERVISLKEGNVSTTSLRINDSQCLSGPARECSVVVSFASPNQRPKGLKFEQTTAIETTSHFSPGTDSLKVAGEHQKEETGVEWTHPIVLRGNAWSAHFKAAVARVTEPAGGRKLLTITSQAAPNSALAGVSVSLCYEIYESFPVIRKWVQVSNQGKLWLKLNRMTIDELEFAANCRQQVPLTPGERGAGPSVIAFGTPDGQRGFIAVSEIPSALRQTRETGSMGYADELFEWVLGPGEQFVSEPVFLLAYDGELEKTISGISTPRDRAVESVYIAFLRKHVGIAADKGSIDTPQWCSWSNFGWALNDEIVREQASLAARCGFALLLLDSGWQKDTIGTEADPAKFPDFQGTCRHIRALGLKLGLWVSCFRLTNSPDMQAMPEARSLPIVMRDGGVGMSFASPWKKFYAEELARISGRYGATYFKQDYTNIKFGDGAEGHESRTRQESLLRGLRGLLEAQDLLRQAAPQVISEITHEIYWGTPGVPCDIAALKHTATYHIPPNAYGGVGHSKQRVSEKWTYDPAKLRQQLITECFNARQRFYGHRGLPLYTLEYYAAHAVNFRGSLTPAIQERQVCSWLMGVPATFAGDLASLTEENIQCYHRLFGLVGRLERDHGIYREFQYSGVPEPTDTDWHWWGKLNEQGAGAVVVIRGSQGANERAVNVPWVNPERTYEVSALLGKEPRGRFTGKQLRDGAMRLQLPPLDQEIIELKFVP